MLKFEELLSDKKNFYILAGIVLVVFTLIFGLSFFDYLFRVGFAGIFICAIGKMITTKKEKKDERFKSGYSDPGGDPFEFVWKYLFLLCLGAMVFSIVILYIADILGYSVWS